jgi:hypothetical protein
MPQYVRVALALAPLILLPALSACQVSRSAPGDGPDEPDVQRMLVQAADLPAGWIREAFNKTVVRYVTHYNVSFVAPDDPVLGQVAQDLYLYPDADIATVAYHKDFLDQMQGLPYVAEVPAPGFESRAALPASAGPTTTLQPVHRDGPLRPRHLDDLDAAPRHLDAAPRHLDAAPCHLDAAPRHLDAAQYLSDGGAGLWLGRPGAGDGAGRLPRRYRRLC